MEPGLRGRVFGLRYMARRPLDGPQGAEVTRHREIRSLVSFVTLNVTVTGALDDLFGSIERI